MERVRFFDHDGHRILLLDCTGCGPNELLEVFEQAKLTIAAEPPHSLLTLADFTGAHFNRQAADQMKITATYNRAHVLRSAIVGVEDLPDVYYHNLVSFSAGWRWPTRYRSFRCVRRSCGGCRPSGKSCASLF